MEVGWGERSLEIVLGYGYCLTARHNQTGSGLAIVLRVVS